MLVRMTRSLQGFLVGCAVLALSACGARRSVVVQPSSQASYHRSPQSVPAPHPAANRTYRVQKGDTLYSIAFRHGTDFRNLASWNGIAAPYTIWPGQELVLAPPSVAGRPLPPPTVAHVAAPVSPLPARAPMHAPAPVTAHVPVSVPVPASSVVEVPVAGEPASTSPPPAPVMAAPKGATRSTAGITWRWPAEGQMIKGFQSGDAIPGIEIGGHAGNPVRAAADGVVVYSGNGLVGYGELVIVKHNDSFLSAYGHNRKRLVKEGQRVTAGQEIAEMGSTGAPRDELQFQIRRNGNPVNPLDYLPSR